MSGAWSAESSRKAVHVGAGLLVLPLPWVFDRPEPVYALAAAFFLLLLGVRLVPALRQGRGQVLHAVRRKSWGELCFPLVVALLFDLALWLEIRLLFVIPLLVLTLADAAAALVGVRWGRHRYRSAGADKSWEGSLAFLAVAVACVFIPLAATGWPPQKALLIALNIGLLTMLIEGASWTGLDNLFTPLLAFGMLNALEATPAPGLWLCLGVTASCGVFLRLWSRRTSLDTGARFGAVVVLVALWLMGGPTFLAAPLAVFVLYTLRWNRHHTGTDAHDAQAVLSLVAPGLFWLVTGGVNFGARGFHLAFAALLPCLAVQRCAPGNRAGRLAGRALGWSVLAWAIVLLPSLRLVGGHWDARASDLGRIALAGLLFTALRHGRELHPPASHRWIGLCAWLGSWG